MCISIEADVETGTVVNAPVDAMETNSVIPHYVLQHVVGATCRNLQSGSTEENRVNFANLVHRETIKNELLLSIASLSGRWSVSASNKSLLTRCKWGNI